MAALRYMIAVCVAVAVVASLAALAFSRQQQGSEPSFNVSVKATYAEYAEPPSLNVSSFEESGWLSAAPEAARTGSFGLRMGWFEGGFYPWEFSLTTTLEAGLYSEAELWVKVLEMPPGSRALLVNLYAPQGKATASIPASGIPLNEWFKVRVKLDQLGPVSKSGRVLVNFDLESPYPYAIGGRVYFFTLRQISPMPADREAREWLATAWYTFKLYADDFILVGKAGAVNRVNVTVEASCPAKIQRVEAGGVTLFEGDEAGGRLELTLSPARFKPGERVEVGVTALLNAGGRWVSVKRTVYVEAKLAKSW